MQIPTPQLSEEEEECKHPLLIQAPDGSLCVAVEPTKDDLIYNEGGGGEGSADGPGKCSGPQ